MKKEIEEQFDKRFTDYPGGVYLKEKPARKEDILDFIEKLIQQERERIINKTIKELNGVCGNFEGNEFLWDLIKEKIEIIKNLNQ